MIQAQNAGNMQSATNKSRYGHAISNSLNDPESLGEGGYIWRTLAPDSLMILQNYSALMQAIAMEQF